MSEMRAVGMTDEQAEILDTVVVPALMRSDDTHEASHMMALVLAYKFAEPQAPALPSNVYPIVTHAGDNWSRKAPSA